MTDDAFQDALKESSDELRAYLRKLGRKRPQVAKQILSASINRQDHLVIQIDEILNSQATIIDRARQVSKRERDKLAACVHGNLDSADSYSLLDRYVEALEGRLAKRLRTRSRLYWYFLMARMWPRMRLRDESAWSESLINRVVELAIFKFGKLGVKDMTIVGRMAFLEEMNPDVVQRLIEIIDLCRELYYATASMRRTAKGGVLDLATWTIDNDPSTERLIKCFDQRHSEYASPSLMHGLYIIDETVESSEQESARSWLTAVAVPNRDRLIWPLRTSTATKELATSDDDPSGYCPNYIIQTEDFSATANALLPFRASLEPLLGFRLEDYFACIRSFWLIAMFAEAEPVRLATIERTSYITPRRSQIVEYMEASMRQTLPPLGIAFPSDLTETVNRVIDFLILEDPLTVDLRVRRPLKPLTTLADERIRIDFKQTGLALLEPLSLVPKLIDSDAQRRSDEFEEAVHSQILSAAPGSETWRKSSDIVFDDGTGRNIDSGIIIDDVLLVSECKARSVGDNLELAAPGYLKNRWETSVHYLDDVDSLSVDIVTKTIKNPPQLPERVRFILPVVVQPAAEFIPDESERFWLIPGTTPRVLTVNELIEVSKMLAKGDKSLDNLVRIW